VYTVELVFAQSRIFGCCRRADQTILCDGDSSAQGSTYLKVPLFCGEIKMTR